jgi:FlaA1/EpsC-like NDP-sugar epimerase
MPLDVRDEQLLYRLLDRGPRAALTAADRNSVAGRRLLVTGAGGSIGSELARQLAECGPASLTLLDHAEGALFRIERELRERVPSLDLAAALADITRPNDVRRAFAAARPEVVYHAAACKHVGMLERDVLSALRSNLGGTLLVARQARMRGASLVMISSDKAARPTSVMGASKRLAELAVLAEPALGDRAVIVRFGNILGSSGSVLELMIDRIRRGRSLQVTDRGASRYFMSPSEAVSLVIKAGAVGRTGQILWLDMGEPVGILDLAERVRTLAVAAGLPPVPIEIVGLRAGEKLREDLTAQGLELVETTLPQVFVARQQPFNRGQLRTTVHKALRAVSAGDSRQAFELLCSAVADYTPSAQARASAGAQPPRRAARTSRPCPATSGRWAALPAEGR